jgi:hypothetical protein
MPYSGQTYIIPCDAGGWNGNPNIDLVPPTAMTDVKNINLHKGGRGTRGGVDPVNGTVISGAPQIMGVYQFRLKNGNSFIVTATNDGKIQKNYTTTVLKTGLTADKYSLFETFENVLYVCNGADVPETWNGAAATTTTLAAIPTDWAGTNQPKQMIKHGRGNSERLWAFGCPLNPERIYASENGAADFTDVKVLQINIETSDGFGIVAGIEYGDRIFFFGKRNTYLIDDSSTTVTDWGYELAQWTGGAAHERLVCKTPNDVIVVTEDLDVYSLTAVQSYGDYKAASLTRPAHINRWIDANVDKSQINKFHIVYDPELRAVKLFVVRNGQTQVDTCLVFFTDLGAKDGWTKHEFASANFASCSALVRVSAGSWKIYAGGYNGFVYQLETTTFNDDGVYYYNGFTAPYVPIENARTTKRFDRLWFIIVPQGTASGAYESEYPPAQSATYVKATNESAGYAAYQATDPTTSLIGATGVAPVAWMTDFGTVTNQRFHIDIGSEKIIKKIYYENFHTLGGSTDRGVQNFTLWGSNEASAFADTTYATDTNWTQLTPSQEYFDQHSALDAADPKYITVLNNAAYRYYAFKFADNWGSSGVFGHIGVRRIELQTQSGALETINANVLIDGQAIVGAFFLVDEKGNNVVDENGNYLVCDSATFLSVTATASLTLQNLSARLGKTGQRIQVEVYNETIDTSFFVSQIMLDFMPLGSKAY